MKPSRKHIAPSITASSYGIPWLVSLLAIPALSIPASATVMYWDGNGTLSTNWTNTANLYSLADGSNPAAAAGASDDVVFVYTGLDNTMYLSQTTGTISVRSVTFTNTGISQIRAGGGSRTLNIGAGGITVNSGAGAVLLGRANGTTGAVTLTFKLTADQVWTNNDNDTLDFYYGGTGSGGGVLGSAIDTNGKILTLAGTGSFSLDTPISGTGALTKGGIGTATIGNSFGATGANTYSGTTTINEGTLIVQGGNAILDTGAVSLANTTGAQVQLNASETIGSLAGGGTSGGNVNLQANALTVGDSNSTLYAGVLSGTNGGVVKTGIGTLSLSGSNSYSGATSISEGTLAITGSGSINSTTGVTIASGATLRYNSSVAYSGGSITNNGGTITGTGPIGVAVALDSLADKLAPGNSPGIQTYSVGQTWNSFTYQWETNNLTGNTAGTNFDQLGINGSLTLTGAAANSYALDIFSLTGSNTSGAVPNFAETSRQWTILTTTGGITGFNAAYWNILTSGFTSSPTWTGNFSVTADSNNIYLNYAAVPEPRAAMIGSIGLCALLRRRRF